MDISNSLIQPGVQNTLTVNRDKNQDLPENSGRRVPERASKQEESSDPELLEKVSNEKQENRIQRDNAIESASLRTQQAVNSYQSTIDAAQEFEQGELVGIDLYI